MVDSKVKEVEKVDEYPKLMKSMDSGVIVLFTESEIGTVVFSPDAKSIRGLGKHLSGWNIVTFEPFHGTIELTNIK